MNTVASYAILLACHITYFSLTYYQHFQWPVASFKVKGTVIIMPYVGAKCINRWSKQLGYNQCDYFRIATSEK